MHHQGKLPDDLHQSREDAPLGAVFRKSGARPKCIAEIPPQAPPHAHAPRHIQKNNHIRRLAKYGRHPFHNPQFPCRQFFFQRATFIIRSRLPARLPYNGIQPKNRQPRHFAELRRQRALPRPRVPGYVYSLVHAGMGKATASTSDIGRYRTSFFGRLVAGCLGR